MKRVPFICLWIVGFYAAGIMLSFYNLLNLTVSFWLILTVLFSIIVFYQKNRFVFIALLIFFLLFGAFYNHVRQTPRDNDISSVYRFYRGKTVDVRLQIVSDVQYPKAIYGQKTSFIARALAIQSPWGWQKISGTVLVNIFREESLSYGDIIEIKGKLHKPYNFSKETNFSYRDYLLFRGMRYILSVKKTYDYTLISSDNGWTFKRRAYQLRKHIAGVLDAHLSMNESGIIKAMLIGDRSHIPPHIRQLFVQTGTVHILAISGLHIGIIAGLFFFILRLLPCSRREQIICTVCILVAYLFVTAGRPSVMRAVIMTSIFLLSFVFERSSSQWNALGLAAFVILLINPLYIFDIGFQLSFACVFSILMIAPVFRLPVESGWIKKYLAGSLGVSVSAFIGSSGLIAYYFSIITPVSIFANLFVVPLLGLLICLGWGVVLIGSLNPAWAFAFALPLKCVLNAMAFIIYLFAQIPGGHILTGNVSIYTTMFYYLIIMAITGSFVFLRTKIDKAKRL